MGDFKHALRVREHLSHPLILSVSHSGSMLLLSPLLFDPCLMRVLDHQYSNYITWKRGKPLFFSSQFLQSNPSASLMLSFLIHCLCYLFFFLWNSSKNLLQFGSDVLLCALLHGNYYYFPPTGLFTFKAIYHSRAHLFYSSLLHVLPAPLLLTPPSPTPSPHSAVVEKWPAL